MRSVLPVLCIALLCASGCSRDESATPASLAPSAPAVADAAAPAPATSGTLTDPASGARCDGQDVAITRDGFELVLEGTCGDIVITASNGAVNVDRATSVRVEGSQVTVLNSRVERVDVRGTDNTLNLTDVGTLDVSGDRNLVLARGIERVTLRGASNTVNPDNAPAVEDSGTGNRVL